VIALIEQAEVILKISKYLGLRGNRGKMLPRANEPPERYDA
jgi:hypothetical protein